MPNIQVDEAEYNRREQLRQAVAGMLGNPNSRKLMLEAQKIAYPNSVVPEIDAAKPLQDGLAEIRKEISDWKKLQEDKETKAETERRTNEFRAAWELGKKSVRDRYPDYNDKAIDEIEKFATEKGIPDFEAAAARFRELNPPARIEAPSGGSAWNFFEQPQDSVKDFMEKAMKAPNDDILVDNQARAVLAEVRGGRRV